MSEIQARWWAELCKGSVKLPPKPDMKESISKELVGSSSLTLSTDILFFLLSQALSQSRWFKSERHTIQRDPLVYCDEIATFFGARPEFRKHPGLAWRSALFVWLSTELTVLSVTGFYSGVVATTSTDYRARTSGITQRKMWRKFLWRRWCCMDLCSVLVCCFGWRIALFTSSWTMCWLTRTELYIVMYSLSFIYCHFARQFIFKQLSGLAILQVKCTSHFTMPSHSRYYTPLEQLLMQNEYPVICIFSTLNKNCISFQ